MSGAGGQGASQAADSGKPDGPETKDPAAGVAELADMLRAYEKRFGMEIASTEGRFCDCMCDHMQARVCGGDRLSERAHERVFPFECPTQKSRQTLTMTR